MLYDEEGRPHVEPPLLPEEQHLAYVVRDYQRMYRMNGRLKYKVERMAETNTRISHLNYAQGRLILEYAVALQHCFNLMDKHKVKLTPYLKNVVQPKMRVTFSKYKSNNQKQTEL